MRLPIYYFVDGDALAPTGKSTSVSAVECKELLNLVMISMCGERGRGEYADFESVEDALRKHNMIDDDYDEDEDDE